MIADVILICIGLHAPRTKKLYKNIMMKAVIKRVASVFTSAKKVCVQIAPLNG